MSLVDCVGFIMVLGICWAFWNYAVEIGRVFE